ncbi:MAG: SGNH/GDSL hydrolase family protein, partial [Alphaproteobacteria bacterium]
MSEEPTPRRWPRRDAHASSAGRGARAALVVAGLLLGVAAGEAGARLVGFRFHPHMRNRVHFAEPDRLLGWRNRAGVGGPYGGNEFETWVTINEAGQRGPSHPLERRPGVARVAILGDSQAWGDGVGDDETFAALLDRAARGRVEVLDFACPGYGTDQELLLFDREVVRWRPDVVMIAVFVGNDPKDNLSDGNWQYPKPRFDVESSGELVLRGTPIEPRPLVQAGIGAYRFAMRHSALLNAIAEATNGDAPSPGHRLPEHPTIYNPVYGPMPDPKSRRALDVTGRLLLELVAHVRASGARPVVVLLPELWQVDVAVRPVWRADLAAARADWRRPQRSLRRALAADGVETID